MSHVSEHQVNRSDTLRVTLGDNETGRNFHISTTERGDGSPCKERAAVGHFSQIPNGSACHRVRCQQCVQPTNSLGSTSIVAHFFPHPSASPHDSLESPAQDHSRITPGSYRVLDDS
ncbi:hypothetical protein ABTZ21_01200 [Streptomyces sp. NPDC096191]|uniref:hypothetical protein n=1 Tax=Streptomyces sp. NPDC096191 TaxID=3155426 RepID=UPI003320D964